MKPKEIIRSLAIEDLIFRTVTSESYREGTELLNRFLHRGNNSHPFKLRTISDHVNSVGRELKKDLNCRADEVLTQYMFSVDGLTPPEDRKNILPDPEMFDQQNPKEHFESIISEFNELRIEEAKITNMSLVQKTEINPDECVYIFLDDVGVSHQKDTRKNGGTKNNKKVENTVIRIRSGDAFYSITDTTMDNALRLLLSFLLFNNLLQSKKLCFFSDGAKNIKAGLEKYFSFVDYTLHLDWYHLEKHLDESLSMAMYKPARDILQPVLLSILWAGNTDTAISYMEELKTHKGIIKNMSRLQEAIDYLKRKQPYIDCYALRKINGYINSSNPAEKENDLLVAQRQKHNGMSWSYSGSGALAVIEAQIHNDEFLPWLSNRSLSFSLYA